MHAPFRKWGACMKKSLDSPLNTVLAGASGQCIQGRYPRFPVMIQSCSKRLLEHWPYAVGHE